MKSETEKPGYIVPRHIAILLLLILVCHGLLVLNDGVYMDGWILYGLYLNRDAESLLSIFREAGTLGHGYFHLAFWDFPNPVLAYKLTAFFSILLSTVLVYVLACRTQLLNSRESLFLAAIFCSYPAYKVHVEIIMVPSIFLYALFLLGAYTALLAFEKPGWRGLALRLLSLFLFFCSFQLQSLLVFYFPCLLLLLVISDQSSKQTLQTFLATIVRHGEFILLPFVFWVIKQLIWIPHGLYSGRNQLTFDLETWFFGLISFLHGAVISQFAYAWQALLSRPLLFALLACLSLFTVLALERQHVNANFFRNAEKSVPTAISYKPALYMALIAMGFLFCAIFPYIAVGKYATSMGWGTRLSLLVGLPIAIGCVAIGRLVALASTHALTRPALLLSSVLLVIGFTIVVADSYIRLQARWIKDSSVIVNLQKLPDNMIKRLNVFIVDDQFRIPANDAGYDFYEYAGMFKLAWHDESRIGFIPSAAKNTTKLIETYPLKRYLLKDFRLGGCHAMLHIRPRDPTTSHLQLVVSYFEYRWLKPTELQTFLESVTLLELTDMSCLPLEQTIGKLR